MSENSNEICYFGEFLPAEIKHEILSYLSLSDLLNLCEASKSLNDFIGQSHDCMKKIWIKFYSFKLKDLESLALSSRSYEKLKVNRVKSNEYFGFLSDLQQPWRKTLIYNCEIKFLQQLENFLESFSETIEEIEISDISIMNNEKEVCAIKCPKLKRIMFRNVPSTTLESFLGINEKLENASFDIAQPVEGKLPIDVIVQTILENSESLHHLQLGPHYLKSFFDREDVEMKFSFRLSKLMMKFPIIPDASPNIEDNVVKFLSHQPKIDWMLFLEVRNDRIVNTAWNGIPELKHISFVGLEELFDDAFMELQVEPNENIVQLDLLCWKVLISQLRKLLIAAPCLKILHVHTLTRYLLEFTARNHQLIQEIRYENMDEEVPETYSKLKSSSGSVNNSIKLRKTTFWFDETNPFTLDPTFWRT